jgi:NADH-quinone oxidoreductase subunit C
MQEALDKLKERFGDAIGECASFRGDESCVIHRDRFLDVCRFLKDEMKFDMLTDLCGVDYPARQERFEVVYHLYSVENKKRLRLKVRVPESDAAVPSVCEIWKAANWFEREAYDLFGIRFDGHPNLKRILCHQEFVGHALRKDYPKNRRGVIPTPDPLI